MALPEDKVRIFAADLTLRCDILVQEFRGLGARIPPISINVESVPAQTIADHLNPNIPPKRTNTREPFVAVSSMLFYEDADSVVATCGAFNGGAVKCVYCNSDEDEFVKAQQRLATMFYYKSTAENANAKYVSLPQEWDPLPSDVETAMSIIRTITYRIAEVSVRSMQAIVQQTGRTELCEKAWSDYATHRSRCPLGDITVVVHVSTKLQHDDELAVAFTINAEPSFIFGQ